jgi:hypothetical protein
MYLLSKELNIYPYLSCFKDIAIGQEISYITCPSIDVFPPELITENFAISYLGGTKHSRGRIIVFSGWEC